jgi:hypothetical protein
MNERIKQLAEQAGYTKDIFGIGHWDMPECKKFAELIVRECIGVADHSNVTGKSIIGERIKQHFGVEE